jgi:starch synthase
MYVVMVASECSPVVQVGGLADVVAGLSRELELRGNAVEIILPKYDRMRYEHIFGLTVDFQDLWVPWYGGAIHCSVYFGFVNGRKCFFIEPHSHDNFFYRPAAYGYGDDVMRYAFFSKAAIEYLHKANKRPDVIHCHDWQTALLPVLLFEIYKYHGMENQRVCLTIHNMGHQGTVDAEVLWATGLGRPEYYFNHERLQDNFHPGALNLLKGGIVYSNFVTTVSPHYAWETMNTDQGLGLGPTLWVHRGKFGGVLNGVDYDVWNPEIDPFIARRYAVDSVDLKYHNKRALRERLWLRDGFKPVVAYVGRLDSQKGVHLVRHALFFSLWSGAQFVLLGSSPDPSINDYFWNLKRDLNDNPDCHLDLRFDPELSHLIYAGADLLVVPSNYEPCGLVQMLALRYGTVPVVRAVGGLADTVFDRDYSQSPAEQRNGYVFDHPDYTGIESAMRRALELWHSSPEEFRALMVNGMRCDYSWNQPGHHYSKIYEFIRHR